MVKVWIGKPYNAMHLILPNPSWDKLVLGEWTLTIFCFIHCILNRWYFMLDHICASSEALVRTIWAPGLDPGLWPGVAWLTRSRQQSTRRETGAGAEPSLSTLWYLSRALLASASLCKLYWGDLINADPDRSQSRHNNLAWQRYRVLFVMIIVPLITESQ